MLGGIAVAVAYNIGGDDRVGLIGSAIAGILGFYYFVQQQKLVEAQLFKDLFTEFNSRYDQLNGSLARIANQIEPLSGDDRNIIVDYYNLCAEEYLFYRDGYIYRDVWSSWCRGMLWYLGCHRFREVWEDEVKTQSFYGLSLDEIKKGAEGKS